LLIVKKEVGDGRSKDVRGGTYWQEPTAPEPI